MWWATAGAGAGPGSLIRIDNHSHLCSNGPIHTALGPPVYVCVCNGITDRQVRDVAAAGCRSVAELTMRTGAGAGCGSCLELAAQILEEANSANRSLCRSTCAR